MSAPNCDALTEKRRATALKELANVLESEYFRGSQRCCHFLEYSVHFVLDGRPIHELKERTLGVEVFHKAGDYDTAQDNIVRVTANEVRKRLAQYYGNAHHSENLTIQLPSGSYAADLRWSEEDSPPPAPGVSATEPGTPVLANLNLEEVHRSRIGWQITAACVLTLAVLSAVIVYRHMRATDAIYGVWSPILENPRAAVICISQPLAYRPNSNMDIPLGPEDRMIPMADSFVGTGDAFALADIARLLSTRGKDWQLLPGNSTPSQTLLAGPIILIGVHANKWTRDMMGNLRFFFGIDNAIYDRSNPNVKWSLDNLAPDWKTDEDYALVSRFTNPGSGQPVIVIAGLTNFGTQAAGEFFTDQSLLSEALQKAPKDWRHKNFQFVLHTKIIGNTPERPTVVATNYW
jgi:hypothetical protein